MAPPGFVGLRTLADGGTLDDDAIAAIADRCEFVAARYDTADFRVLVLIKVMLAWGAGLPVEARDEIAATLQNHRYWMDEPGRDGMCLWSENHQIIAAVTEYLAGQQWPETTFGNSGLTGAEHRAKASARLRQWLDHRFRFGFSEWLSPTYYEEHIAALVVFIDEAEDAELVARATIVLDLLLLDLALHCFPGEEPRFLPSAGRCYDAVKHDPAEARVLPILAEIVGSDAPWEEDRLAALFRLRRNYGIPELVQAIATSRTETTVRASFGLDSHEVIEKVGPGVNEAGLFFWAMEAFTQPESIELTAEMMYRFDLAENTFLKPMAPFAEMRGRNVLGGVLTVLNPATQGTALQRADVLTTRSDRWMLSAAQLHHPRTFGDQQHIWQVLLPGDVSVFSTHPATPWFDDPVRNFSPGAWVGHGRLPLVGADQNVVLALHDLSGRSGYLENERKFWTHLHWPASRFDEWTRGARWVAGRVGDSYVGVLALEELHAIEDELRQFGKYTAWATVCSDASEAGSFDDFIAGLTRSAMRVRRIEGRRAMEFELDPMWEPARERWQWRLGADGFMIDGERVEVRHPRLDSPYGRVERDPERMELIMDGHRWSVDWRTGERAA